MELLPCGRITDVNKESIQSPHHFPSRWKTPSLSTLTLFQAWISNYIHYKVLDVFAYPFPNCKRCNRWSLGMDKQFHPRLYCAYDYLSMLRFKFIHITKWAQALSQTHDSSIPLSHVNMYHPVRCGSIFKYVISKIQDSRIQTICSEWYLEQFLWHCYHQLSTNQPHGWWFNTGSGNGLVPSSMLTQIHVVIWHH